MYHLESLQILIGTWNVSLQRAHPDRLSQDIKEWIQNMAQSLEICSQNIPKSLHSDFCNLNPKFDAAQPQVLTFKSRYIPDIIIFGFQEWTGFFRMTQPKVEEWLLTIQRNLDLQFPGITYILQKYAKCIGLVMIVAVRSSPTSREDSSQGSLNEKKVVIQNIFASTVALGRFYCGNKGALGIYLDVVIFNPEGRKMSMTMCLVNTHMEAHSKNVTKRRENYFSVGRDLCFFKVPESLREEQFIVEGPEVPLQLPFDMNEGDRISLFDADAVFWFGDLNSRLYDPSFFEENSIFPTTEQGSDNSERFGIEQPYIFESSPANIPESLRISPHLPQQITSNTTSNGKKFCLAGLKSEPMLEDNFEGPLTVPAGGLMIANALPPLALPAQFYSLMTTCLYARQWDKLFLYDQLMNDRKYHFSFQEFREPYLQFPPTYKYVMKNTPSDLNDGHHLDMAEYKAHWPAWCDRILYTTPDSLMKFRGQSYNPAVDIGPEQSSQFFMTPSGFFVKKKQRPPIQIIPLIYESCAMTRTSDHKPVYAFFTIEKSILVTSPPPQLAAAISSNGFEGTCLQLGQMGLMEPSTATASCLLRHRKRFGFWLSHILLIPLPSLIGLIFMFFATFTTLIVFLYLTFI